MGDAISITPFAACVPPADLGGHESPPGAACLSDGGLDATPRASDAQDGSYRHAFFSRVEVRGEWCERSALRSIGERSGGSTVTLLAAGRFTLGEQIDATQATIERRQLATAPRTELQAERVEVRAHCPSRNREFTPDLGRSPSTREQGQDLSLAASDGCSWSHRRSCPPRPLRPHQAALRMVAPTSIEAEAAARQDHPLRFLAAQSPRQP